MTTKADNFTHIVNPLGQPLCRHDQHPEYEWPDIMPMSGCPYCRKQVDDDSARQIRDLENDYNTRRNDLANAVYDKLVDFERHIHDNRASYFDHLNQINFDKQRDGGGS